MDDVLVRRLARPIILGEDHVIDRAGQVWLIGFAPYQWPTVVVATEEVSATLSIHTLVRLDGARPFEVEESIYYPLERRSDLKRMA